MNILTIWLREFYKDCPFKLKYKTIDKEGYRQDLENRNYSILPISFPEFVSKDVSLGQVENDLKSHFVLVEIQNAGYKQPHEYILNRIEGMSEGRVLLAFSSAHTNWPIGRLVMLNQYNKIIRNDFKNVYNLSWSDYKESKYQPKEKRVVAVKQTGKTSGKVLLYVNLD